MRKKVVFVTSIVLWWILLKPDCPVFAAEHVLTSSDLKVVVDTATGWVSQIYTTGPNGSQAIFEEGDAILYVRSRTLRPVDFWVPYGDATSLILVSPRLKDQSSELPLRTVIRYQLVGNRLKVAYRFDALELLELAEGLDIEIWSTAFDRMDIRNHFSGETRILIGTGDVTRYYGLNEVYEFRNPETTLNLLFRNPYHSLATVRTRNLQEWCQFKWNILAKSEPFGALDPKGPVIASVLRPGIELHRQVELIVTDEDDGLTQNASPVGYFSPWPNGADQVIAMTFDDIPFEGAYHVPKSGHDPDAPRQQHMIRLMENHPKMKQGWVILADAIFSESGITNLDYPPGKWWRAHGKSRILTLAPPEYLQWLRNVESDSVVYGYEHRVHLGTHGYHHTPEMDFEHTEFQFYDPLFNDSTFAAIVDEQGKMGLTAKSRRWIRFPGFDGTRATIETLIRQGFVLFDYWDVVYHLPWMLFYSEYGHIWGIGTHWQGDTPDTYAKMDSLFLSKGKLCHTAGHPYKWFDWKESDPEASFEQIDEIFSRAERDYPNLDYMFPDEVGDFADETYHILDIDGEYDGDAYVFSFTGSAGSGQTIVIEWPASIPDPDHAEVDGLESVDTEMRGEKVLITLPALGDGAHIVRVPAGSGNAHDFGSEVVMYQNYPNPFNPATTISFVLPKRERAALSIYNIEGKLVTTLFDTTLDEGLNGFVWGGKDSGGVPVSSGVYFCRLTVANESFTKKMVLLR